MRFPLFFVLIATSVTVGLGAVPASAGDASAGVALVVGAFEGPIAPEGGAKEAPIGIEVDCARLAALAPADRVLNLSLEQAPTWARLEVSPAAVALPSGECSGAARAAATLTARVTREAPAFMPSPVSVVARFGSAEGERAAEAAAVVQADYFAQVAVRALKTSNTGDPQVMLTYPIELTNEGNANTKVTIEVLSATPGFTVVAPQPIVLESRQAGGSKTTETVEVFVQNAYRNGVVDESGAIELRVKSAYALDATREGEPRTLALTARSQGLHVPGPAIPILLVGLAGAAVAERARR